MFDVQALMLELPHKQLEVKHYFSQGVYARELIIPKDTIVIGHLHKYQQLNILKKFIVSHCGGPSNLT